MNEEIIKAHQTAELLCQDLLAIHKRLCFNGPTVEQHLAERYVLELIRKAVDINISIRGLSVSK